MNESSPFYDDIADERERERSKLHAREYYEQCSKNRTEAFAGHVDYGKWLIASLLAVHGGAIYGISGLQASVKPEQLSGLINGAAWNLAGVFLTLVAGFTAWLNFQCAEHLYDNWTDPAVLYRGDKYPSKDEAGTTAITVTVWIAAIMGIISSICFLISAVTVIFTLKGI